MKQYTEAELEQFTGKNIRVKCMDGMTITGYCTGFTRAIDNTPEVAEIGLKTEQYPTGITSIILPDIKEIEVEKGA